MESFAIQPDAVDGSPQCKGFVGCELATQIHFVTIPSCLLVQFLIPDCNASDA